MHLRCAPPPTPPPTLPHWPRRCFATWPSLQRAPLASRAHALCVAMTRLCATVSRCELSATLSSAPSIPLCSSAPSSARRRYSDCSSGTRASFGSSTSPPSALLRDVAVPLPSNGSANSRWSGCRNSFRRRPLESALRGRSMRVASRRIWAREPGRRHRLSSCRLPLVTRRS